MKGNTGSLDRIVRLVVGLAIMAAGYYFRTWVGALGAVLIVTAAVGFCPLYASFGFTTKTGA